MNWHVLIYQAHETKIELTSKFCPAQEERFVKVIKDTYIMELYPGGVAQMVERSLSMREVPGSIPGASIPFIPYLECQQADSLMRNGIFSFTVAKSGLATVADKEKEVANIQRLFLIPLKLSVR